MIRGDAAFFKNTCSLIDIALQQPPPGGELEREKIHGEYSILRSFDNLGTTQKMHGLLREALLDLDGQSSTFMNKDFVLFDIPSALAACWTGEESLAAQIEETINITPIYTQLTNGHRTGQRS